jgi:CheY-like chemotaxis protein
MKSPVSALESPVITPAPLESGAQRVLVVDGDKSSRSILEVALKRSGFEVATSTTAREAMLSLAAGAAPSVLVLASDLHGEDGYSLCAQLRGEPRFEKLPVLLLARRDEDERLALAEAVGADDLVAKPAFARDIAALVLLRVSPKDERGYALDTSVLPLPLALRAVLSAQRAGQIQLGPKSFIGFKTGRVTHAEIGGSEGIDALVRLLTLAKGPYRVTFVPPNKPMAIDVPLRELVNQIFPRLARWEQLAARSVPLEARFQVDFAALAKALPTIPDAVNDVVRLFDGQRPVRQVLFDSPLNETVTLEVANRLHLMGIVRPTAKRDLEEIELLRAAPPLFIPKQTEASERMSELFGAIVDPEAIVTPREIPAVRGGDWYEAPIGTGLDVADPTEGWQVGAHVAGDIAVQLAAFNIPAELEESEKKAAPPEVAAFSRGVHEETPPSPLEQALAPIQLTDVLPAAPAPTAAVAQTSLEATFFAEGETEVPEIGDDDKTPPSGTQIPELGEETASVAPRAPDIEASFFADDTEPDLAPNVADAVLGPEPKTASADGASARLMAILGGAVLALAAVAVVGWRLTGGETPAPAELVAPAPEAAAPAVNLEVPQDEVELTPAPEPDMSVSVALAEAKNLYEAGRLKEALEALDRVVATEASSVRAWQLMGMARYDNGDTRGAEEAARTVLALAPDYADAYLLLATLHIDSGQKDVARTELEKYLELQPEGPHANEAKALLRR